MQIEVDRDKLAAYRLSIMDVVNAINRFSTAQPAGRLTFNSNESIIRIDTLAQPDTLHRLLNIPLAAIDLSGTVSPLRGSDMGSMVSGMGSMGSMSGSEPMTRSPEMPTPKTILPGVAVPSPQPSLPNSQLAKRIIYLKDVATVRDSYWERRSGYFLSSVTASKLKSFLQLKWQ